MSRDTQVPEYLMSWRQRLNMLLSPFLTSSMRAQGQKAAGYPGVRKHRAKRKIKNRMAKLSRRANRR